MTEKRIVQDKFQSQIEINRQNKADEGGSKKYNRPSHLKQQIEWANTEEGKAYYERKLKR